MYGDHSREKNIEDPKIKKRYKYVKKGETDLRNMKINKSVVIFVPGFKVNENQIKNPGSEPGENYVYSVCLLNWSWQALKSEILVIEPKIETKQIQQIPVGGKILETC